MLKKIIFTIFILGVTAVQVFCGDDTDVIVYPNGLAETANLRYKLIKTYLDESTTAEKAGNAEGMIESLSIAQSYMENNNEIARIEYQLGLVYGSLAFSSYLGAVKSYVDSAEACFNRAIALDSNLTETYLALLQLYKEAQIDDEYDRKSIAVARLAYERNPVKEIYFELASLYAKNQRFNECNEVIEQFADKFSINYAYVLGAVLNFDGNNPAGGVDFLEKYLLSYPKNSNDVGSYIQMRSLTLPEIKVFIKYIDTLNSYSDTSIIDSFVVQLLDNTVHSDSFDKKEIKKLKKLTEKSNLDSETKNVILANLELAGGDFDDASEIYDEIKFTRPATVYSAVFANLNYGQKAKATEIVDKYSEYVYCRTRQEYNQIINLLMRAEKLSESVSLNISKNMLSADTVFCDYFFYVGMNYNSINQIDSAIAYYKQAYSCSPENLNYMNSLSYNLALKGEELKLALTLSQQCVETEPENYFFLDTYAWVNFLLGNDDIAYYNIKKAIELNSSSEEMWEHLISILEKLGKFEEANDAKLRVKRINENNNRNIKE